MKNIPMTTLVKTATMRHSQCGVSLVIVLIMMIIIGISAASAMRSATSEQRATNNMRMASVASQYAEAALRFCENELKKASAARVLTLQNANIVTTSYGATTSGWQDTASWTGTAGISSASRTVVPDAIIKDTADTVLPTTKPECIVENMSGYGIVTTARGFSTDYEADVNGNTIRGAVVWLQSISN